MKDILREDYKKILESIPIPCVDIIIVRNNKIFMVKRKNNPAKGEWWMPGGRILKNESLEAAAIRKSYEETGLNVKIIKPLIFEETIFDEPSIEGVKSGAHTVNVSFLAEARSNGEKIDEQSSDYKWADKIEKEWPPYVKKVVAASGVFS